MTKAELLSKYEYHITLMEVAICHGNYADAIIEGARAELAFMALQRA